MSGIRRRFTRLILSYDGLLLLIRNGHMQPEEIGSSLLYLESRREKVLAEAVARSPDSERAIRIFPRRLADASLVKRNATRILSEVVPRLEEAESGGRMAWRDPTQSRTYLQLGELLQTNGLPNPFLPSTALVSGGISFHERVVVEVLMPLVPGLVFVVEPPLQEEINAWNMTHHPQAKKA